MSKPVPRSRLNITYRTRIDGVPVKQKLPLRLLVLGDFSGGCTDKLENRPVRSILSGMKLDSFMEEMQVTAPIEDRALACTLTGELRCVVRGTIKKELPNGKAVVRLEGKGTVTGERAHNGLGSFSGEVTVTGEVEAPLADEKVTITDPRLTVQGSVEGEITGNVRHVFTGELQPGMLEVDHLEAEIVVPVPVELTIPIRNLRGFSPEHISEKVPEIRRLLLLRRLILEMRAFIANRSELRTGFKDVLEHPDLPRLREWLIESYPQLRIDSRAARPAPGPAATPTPPASQPPSPPAPPPAAPAQP
jgi:predicted component of type VI protein secretion system